MFMTLHEPLPHYSVASEANILSARHDHTLVFVNKYNNSMVQLHRAEKHSRADKPAWHHICPFLL